MRLAAIGLASLAVAALTGCATPPGKLKESDFITKEVSFPFSAKDAAANFRDGLRYCGSEGGSFGRYIILGVPDCGQERSDGTLTCDLYLDKGLGLGRADYVLGIVDFKPAPTGSTARLRLQRVYAVNSRTQDGWEKLARGEHKDICGK